MQFGSYRSGNNYICYHFSINSDSHSMISYLLRLYQVNSVSIASNVVSINVLLLM